MPTNFIWKTFMDCTLHWRKTWRSCKYRVCLVRVKFKQRVYCTFALTRFVGNRDKMGSLPQIVNEIWTALGDTGQTIRKSIVWFIDNVSIMTGVIVRRVQILCAYYCWLRYVRLKKHDGNYWSVTDKNGVRRVRKAAETTDGRRSHCLRDGVH